MSTWEQFLELIPDEGYDTPAARFLLDVLTELADHGGSDGEARVLDLAQQLAGVA